MANIFSIGQVVLDLLNNGSSVDVVGIYNGELRQVFADARPLRAEVRETSMVMKHPVETGTIIADNHIINPVEINLLLIIKSEFYSSVYGQIKQAFVAGDLLSIQTRTGVYNNMIIANMPHLENPDAYDAVTMSLNLVEVLYVMPVSVAAQPLPANFSPAEPADISTVQTGLKYPVAISSTNAAAVQSIITGFAFKFLGGV